MKENSQTRFYFGFGYFLFWSIISKIDIDIEVPLSFLYRRQLHVIVTEDIPAISLWVSERAELAAFKIYGLEWVADRGWQHLALIESPSSRNSHKTVCLAVT